MSHHPARVLLNAMIGVALSACGARHPYPSPMTASHLAAHGAGPALVAYLGQPDAGAAVCDPNARGPHLKVFNKDVYAALAWGLVHGAVEPDLWRRCVDVLLRRLPREEAASLLDAIGIAYRSLIKDPDIETSPRLRARLAAAHRLYLERERGIDGNAEVLDPMFAELRRALDAHRLGPAAARLGQALIATVDLERGRMDGRTVDVPLLDELFAARDEAALQSCARRLTRPELREQARGRLVRLRVGASPFSEVRAHAARVERRVLRDGVNGLSPAAHPPVRGWLDRRSLPMRGVVLRQHIAQQTVTLLGRAREWAPASVLPELSLRRVLMLEVKGISRPVTVCQPRRALDPTPCIPPQQVSVASPVVYRERGGVFRFVDRVPIDNAVQLAWMRDELPLPVSVGGQQVTEFAWRLTFERPRDMVFRGAAPGGRGPDLRVFIDHRDPRRLIFKVGAYQAVVERADVPWFHLVSRGARGAGGTSGFSGDNGASGGTCENGGAGGAGGPGEDGGPGGDGGDIDVEVDCGGRRCSETVAVLRQVIRSDGGAGGSGGAGGPGGTGGGGGEGRGPSTHRDADGNTVVDDPGCSAGSSGADGPRGPDGADGPPGRPGRVRFTVVTGPAEAAPSP